MGLGGGGPLGKQVGGMRALGVLQVLLRRWRGGGEQEEEQGGERPHVRYQPVNGWPVISAGCGRPSRCSRVGAMSASRPSCSAFASLP